MKRLTFYSFLCSVVLLSSCSLPSTKTQKEIKQSSSPKPNTTQEIPQIAPPANPVITDDELKQNLITTYQAPNKEWGENVTGVRTRLNTNDKVIALTFDACGGKNGNGYDVDLIDYLREQQIPATLFINSSWIDANYDTFITLAKDPLFEIENHGTFHKPLSVNGKSAWGIKGTENVGEVVDEVLGNHRKLEKILGSPPHFFRSGTAFYDEVAAKIVNDIGEEPVNFDILGDAGATFNRYQIRNALLKAKPGSIVICHMNHPEKDTAEGIKLVVPELKQMGFQFVKLMDYPLQ
jgi:peptidoglycan/xylan/chitin deacetylase (PgdA/CDA1 family)